MTLSPLHKQILTAIAVIAALFLVWHFFIRKASDEKATLFGKIKAKRKELQACVLKGGVECKGIKDDLTALLHLHKEEVKAVEEEAAATPVEEPAGNGNGGPKPAPAA